MPSLSASSAAIEAHRPFDPESGDHQESEAWESSCDDYRCRVPFSTGSMPVSSSRSDISLHAVKLSQTHNRSEHILRFVFVGALNRVRNEGWNAIIHGCAIRPWPLAIPDVQVLEMRLDWSSGKNSTYNTPSMNEHFKQSSTQSFIVDEATPPVIVAALRSWLPELSWSKVRKLVRTRRVQVSAALCLDESRKLRPGEQVNVFAESRPQPPDANDAEVHYVDRDIVVVDKPPRMVTLRHKKERPWTQTKKRRQPALEEVIPDLIYGPERTERPRVLSVHRIDRDTSGLLVFARSHEMQQALIAQFAAHDVVRVYKSVVLGKPAHQTVRCHLVRDRGDGLRGSTKKANAGKESVTLIKPIRSFRGLDGHEYTEIECQLETGRTHQIRIHLAELGHPVCGDTVYRSSVGQPTVVDHSGAPRLALHATQLGFSHPTTGQPMHFSSPWPPDMVRFVERLEGKPAKRVSADQSGRADDREV